MDNVKHLFGGADLRCVALIDAIEAVIMERGLGMPIPTILGALDLVKDIVKAHQTEMNNRE